MTMIQFGFRISKEISEQGFAVVRGTDYELSSLNEDWGRLSDDWKNLVTDAYMADGGRYRLRRFGRFYFVPATSDLLRLDHAPVYQSQYVNSFAGGIYRTFAPLSEATFENPCLLALIRSDFTCFGPIEATKLSEPWEVWVHQIRIETTGIGAVPPAPEGIHHDGHDFIAMHLVNRENVAGGQNIIYDNSGKPLHSCLLERPLDTIYADDHRVMHAVDPIRTANKNRIAKRDILIIDYDHKPHLRHPNKNCALSDND
jgi:hypothetical protein